MIRRGRAAKAVAFALIGKNENKKKKEEEEPEIRNGNRKGFEHQSSRLPCGGHCENSPHEKNNRKKDGVKKLSA